MIIKTLIVSLAVYLFSFYNSLEKVTAPSPDPGDTIIPFHATWVAQKYITTLIKTKSPRLSQDEAGFLLIPYLYKSRAYPFAYHKEGGDFHVVKNKNRYYLRTDSDPIDSSEIIISDKGSRLEIWDKAYIKVEHDTGIPENILFKGTYLCNDKTVTLFADGGITGLDSINHYCIENDYTSPGSGEMDLIYLNKTGCKHRAYCFQFNADTLLIYSIKCHEEDENGVCIDNRKDKLKYKLLKK